MDWITIQLDILDRLAVYSFVEELIEVLFDFSGVELFWKIVDTFESKHNPQEELWHTLFNSPGYSALTKSEFSQEKLQNAMSIALDPKRAIEAHFSQDASIGGIVSHFQEVVKRRMELETLFDELKGKSANIETDIFDLVVEYLPSNIEYPSLDIAFVFFQRDARGYEWVVIDGLLALELDSQLLTRLIAHEYHHQCRDSILCYDKEIVRPEDQDLMWVLNQTQAEGIADNIDKPRWFYGENPVDAYTEFVQAYRDEVTVAETTLQSIDLIIETGVLEGYYREEIGKEVREHLPMSGHPIGYHMTQIISKANLFGEMIETLGNPFEFFRLYNRALLILKKDGLSESTLFILDDLETRYC
ncbi:MAG: hypothetical protein BAJATHORv1_10629 [Candidatus Thorarchaeota archaeon]|nr:MAG: hypothetical protein BAJATHORv1_10629 [Candidatus Thorarchaeota archaeon]